MSPCEATAELVRSFGRSIAPLRAQGSLRSLPPLRNKTKKRTGRFFIFVTTNIGIDVDEVLRYSFAGPTPGPGLWMIPNPGVSGTWIFPSTTLNCE